MKTRRVVVSLEIETDAKVEDSRKEHVWNDVAWILQCDFFEILEKPKVTVVKLKK